MPTAFITGATAGLGAAFARRLAADGMGLVLLARDADRLEQAADDYRARHGSTVEVLPADLATDDGIATAERRVAEGVDLLVNNAGFAQKGRFLDVPVEDELSMLRVHCEAVLRLTLANVLAISGLKLLNVPDVGLLVALGLAAVFVVGMLVREQRRWRERREDEQLATRLAGARE